MPHQHGASVPLASNEQRMEGELVPDGETSFLKGAL